MGKLVPECGAIKAKGNRMRESYKVTKTVSVNFRGNTGRYTVDCDGIKKKYPRVSSMTKPEIAALELCKAIFESFTEETAQAHMTGSLKAGGLYFDLITVTWVLEGEEHDY